MANDSQAQNQPPSYTGNPPAVAGKPIIGSYPTPNFNDRLYKVRKDSRAEGYRLPSPGGSYTGPDAERYKDFIFCLAVPVDQIGWVDWIFVNDRLNQDAYNFTVEYPWQDQEWPRITRTYVTLRARYAAPDPDEVDPMFPNCILVDQKETILEDNALNVLFVGVTKVFERIPAETAVTLDRADGVLPFNFRVAVPAEEISTIQQGAVQETPAIVDEEDWNITDTTRTVFSRTRKRVKRVIPDGSKTLNKGQRLTREQQLGLRTETWAIGPQTITPRATTIESSVDDIGNNTTVKDELEVDHVFPAAEFKTEIRDIIPAKFDGLSPKLTTAASGEGQASQPLLQVGELERTSQQQTDLIKRDTVVRRDTAELPKTLRDYDIDGIDSHGSKFGGVFETDSTLSADPAGQAVEEGFDIVKSQVESLGNGLTLRETKRLFGFQGAYLELTNPGRLFTCNPEVLFSSGTVGSDAAGTAVISTVPGGGGVTPGQDPGGVFELVPSSLGDTNGLFYFLGARYNGGQFINPALAGDVTLQSVSDPQFPVPPDQLSKIVNRQADSTIIVPIWGSGGHEVIINLRPGTTLKATHFAFQVPTTAITNTTQHTIRIEGSNDGIVWTTLGSDLTLSFTGNRWAITGLTDTGSYRNFRIFGTNLDPVNPGVTPSIYQTMGVSEVELYGELTIVPGSDLQYQFDGDANGVFFYLGERGGNGVWRNPATNGDIVVTADGPIVGSVDQIVDRLPSNVYLDANPARGYNFDLKAGRKLVCNKLSFRQRTDFGSGTLSFNLQGRNDVMDPMDWTDIMTVNPSQAMNAWTTVDVPGSTGYRQFRIISAEPFFTIGELELYGSLVLASPTDTGSVTSVLMTDGGHDYDTNNPPIPRFIGGGGTGAAGTAVVVNGSVVRVDMTNIGQDYTSAPDLRFFVDHGGKNADVDGVITGDAVTSYIINDPGEEYGVAPEVIVVGDGSGATATCTVDDFGQVTSVTPVLGGSGYTFAACVFRNSGGPEGEAVVGYGVGSITLGSPGSSYMTAPAVTVAGDGHGFQGHTILGFPIISVTMNSRGSGYTSTPTANLSGDGSGAACTATRGFPVASITYASNSTLYLNEPIVNVSGGGIYGIGASFRALVGRPILLISVGAQGSGYTPDTTVVVTGDGSGGAAHVVFSYALDAVNVSAGGSAYTTATVVIDPPTGVNGIQATAHAVLLAGAVSSVVIDEPGFGYQGSVNATIVGDGTGAILSVDLEANGAIDSVVVDTAGTLYSEPPAITLTGSGGSGAVLTSALNTAVAGRIVKVIITSNGHGYTSAPTLSIPGGAAAPVAVLGTTGEIVTVSVSSGGINFTRTAIVIFSGGGGSGASATGQLGSLGRVKTIVVDANGEGFTFAPPVSFSGGGGGGGASGSSVLETTGSIKTLTLTVPGGPFSVAPLVSFFGCNGEDATALYILPTGWPILYDIITDPVEGIVVNVEKKIVPAGTVKPAGYVDIYALDKYRSIQITSRVDTSTLPPVDHFFQSHVINLPPTLISVSPTYNRDTSSAVGIDTRFGSTSVKSSVKGKIFARIADGYKGPAKVEVYRKFMFGPPTSEQTPNPLVITPSTGAVYLISRGQNKDTSLGIRSGFGYIEDTISNSEDIDALDISGVLTGGLATSGSSGVLFVDPSTQITAAIQRAQTAGFFFDGFRTQVAKNTVSAEANFIVDIPASCPRQIDPGTVYLLDAGVEKWRFGIYVQTLIYATVPCPQGGAPYPYFGVLKCRACNGGQVIPPPPS